MKEIAERLHENRQVELAKSILESKGYKVSKINESGEEITDKFNHLKSNMITISELVNEYYGSIENFSDDRGGTEELDIPCEMLKGDYNNVYTISEDDDGGDEIVKFLSKLDTNIVKTEHMPGRGLNHLIDSPVGSYVYQNQQGLIIIYMKF